MNSRILKASGHLIDSGLLSNILNTILSKGGDYRIISFSVGKTPVESSHLEIELLVEDNQLLRPIIDALKLFGIFEKEVPSVQFGEVDRDKHAPDSFYSTSNHKTEVYHSGIWYIVEKQRMDGAIVYHEDSSSFICTKLRDLKAGDKVVVGSGSIRIFPPQSEKKELAPGSFAFMTNTVSSERSVDATVEALSKEMKHIKDRGGKTIVVAGPVVVHTGGSDALASIIREGYVSGFLGGNAIAVHDLELRFFGTSLGVDLKTGIAAEHGHSHHMRSINAIYGCGSIENAVKTGLLTSGLMYEIMVLLEMMVPFQRQ